MTTSQPCSETLSHPTNKNLLGVASRRNWKQKSDQPPKMLYLYPLDAFSDEVKEFSESLEHKSIP